MNVVSKWFNISIVDNKISVVINTLNEEKNIERVMKSVNWADEVIVCDMFSKDNTVKIAENLGAKVIFHKELNYVEPARNFAVSKFWLTLGSNINFTSTPLWAACTSASFKSG